MAREISFVFSGHELAETVSLLYLLEDHPGVDHWLKQLKVEKSRKNGLQNKIHNQFFLPNSQTSEKIRKNMAIAVTVINDYKPGTIAEEVPPELTQRDLNHMHVYFETLRGNEADPPKFFRKAPENVRQALCDLNDAIHDYEKHMSNMNGVSEGKRPTHQLNICFPGRKREELADEVFEHFSTERKFGQLELHYSEAGKQLLEVMLDDDDLVGDENIRPMKYCTAEFDLYFGQDIVGEAADWLNGKFADWREKFGVPDVPKNAFGFLKLADLDFEKSFSGMDMEQIDRCLSKIEKLEDVKFFDC